jgi:hypothetical protein
VTAHGSVPKRSCTCTQVFGAENIHHYASKILCSDIIYLAEKSENILTLNILLEIVEYLTRLHIMHLSSRPEYCKTFSRTNVLGCDTVICKLPLPQTRRVSSVSTRSSFGCCFFKKAYTLKIIFVLLSELNSTFIFQRINIGICKSPCWILLAGNKIKHKFTKHDLNCALVFSVWLEFEGKDGKKKSSSFNWA